MTRTPSAFAVLLVAGMLPFVIGARDSLDDARQRLAAMTSAQRKEIERTREQYDKLSSLEKLELREFSKALRELPAAERTELESVMGRLAAWVETFPDDVRTKYFAALPTDRLTILKEQLAAWKRREGVIVAEVTKAENAARMGMRPPFLGGGEKAAKFAREFQRMERGVLQGGNPDDRQLFALLNDQKIKPHEKWIIAGCLGANIIGKRPAKAMGQSPRIEQAAELVPLVLLKCADFVPAFKRLPDDPRGGLPASNKDDLMKVLPQIYLLKPPSEELSHQDLMKRLEVSKTKQPRAMDLPPEYLLQQIALLKDYAEGRKTPPQADVRRVNVILERSK